MLKICITGHRKLLNPDEVRAEIARSFEYFKTRDTELQAISAIAEGADTIFAEEAIKAGIPLKVVLPFSRAEYEKDFSPEGLTLFNTLLNDREPEILYQLKTDNSDERNAAYLETGKKLVDESDIVVAVWDGKPADGKGGTGDIVEYVRNKGKELHIIYGRRTDVVPDKMDSVFNQMDRSAIRLKEWFTTAWIAGLQTGILAVIVYAAGLVYHRQIDSDLKFSLASIEIVYIIISFILLTFLANKWKKDFLYQRRNAEYLRSISNFKKAGMSITVIKQPGFEVDERIQEYEKTQAGETTINENFENAKRIVWDFAEDQRIYHDVKRIDRFGKRTKYMKTTMHLITYIFFTIVLVKYSIEYLEHIQHMHIPSSEFLIRIFDMMLIVIPALYATLEGVKYFSDWKRNISISQNIVVDLEQCKTDIQACSDPDTLVTITLQLRNILELENSEWAARYNAMKFEKAP